MQSRNLVVSTVHSPWVVLLVPRFRLTRIFSIISNGLEVIEPQESQECSTLLASLSWRAVRFAELADAFS